MRSPEYLSLAERSASCILLMGVWFSLILRAARRHVPSADIFSGSVRATGGLSLNRPNHFLAVLLRSRHRVRGHSHFEETSMDKRIIVTVVCSTIGLISTSGFAVAENIGRFDCSVVGPVSQDPIGDKDGHRLVTVQYSCLGVEGMLKGGLYSGSSTSEWDGPKGTYFTGGGIIRAAEGLAVTQLTEGTGAAIMKDGKAAGNEASGKGLIKFASGTLAALSGKADRWEAKPAGFGRFTLDVTTGEEMSTVGAARTNKE
jgi:hypothetical protein